MWQKLGQLEDEEAFLPWAKVIVRFKCLGSIENLRRERLLLSDQVLKLIADEADTTESEFGQLRLALGNCLAKFTASHQELLLAPYDQPGRVKDLANRAGKSANALYKLLGRLRDKLAGCIQTEMQNAGI